MAIARYLDAARLTNPAVVCAGLSINSSSLNDDAWRAYQSDLMTAHGGPVCDPMRGGVEAIARRLLA